MINPAPLKPGDTIGIVSTASRIDKEVVEPAIELLTGLGYHVVVATHAFSSFHQYSATDTERATDLQFMLDHKEIKAIICSRGGYGTLRAIQGINWDSFLRNPKWIVGFSDVTVMHSACNIMNVASIHGVMPRYFIEDNKPGTSFETLILALEGKQVSYELPFDKYNRFGRASAPLVGGNLSILYSLRGTKYDIDTRQKILFIEDLGEYLYHLDRMMMNLKTGGKLEHLAGLIVGNFTGMKDLEVPYGKTVEEIILDSVSEYDFPVVFNFPAGHSKDNFALKMGTEITLHIHENGSSIYQT